MVAFRATTTATTLRADVSVAFRATKNLEDTMLPVNYRSWQCSFLELSKSCHQWELAFLLTIVLRATKILSAVEVDIPADRSFQSYQNPDNFKNYHTCRFQSHQKPGRHYASHQLLELTISFSELQKSCQQWELTFLSTVALIATKIMTALRADILVASRAT